MILLLTSLAMAMEAPAKPEKSAPVEGQCDKAYSVKPGYTAGCRGVLLPTSWMADYQLLSAYNDMLIEVYRIDTSSLEHKLDYTESLLQEARKPVPVWEKPAFWTGIGLVAGMAAVIGGGYAMTGGS